MMKKLIFVIIGVAILGIGVTILFTKRNSDQEIGNKRLPLPIPDVVNTASLRLIDARVSTKTFDSEREIDQQIISEILWAAWGVNSNGKRTIPTSRNRQDLAVYAVMPHGAFLYDAMNNNLIEITNKDLRPLFATQDYVMDAFLTLVYVGTDIPNATLHAGSAYQNVALYAVEMGLGTVIRAMFDRDTVHSALGLKSTEQPIITQTIGWPKK